MNHEMNHINTQKNIKQCCKETAFLIPSYPDHKPELTRLNRVKGQIEGIMKMISEGRYCMDILVQFKAVSNALLATEKTILDKHIRSCVLKAMTSKNKKEMNQKIEELTALVCRS